MSQIVSLYDGKTQLSALVDRAAAGEEIVITSNGVPPAKIVPLPALGAARIPADALGVTHISEDFEAPDPDVEALFNGA